jgi:hypothetical protein
MIWRWLLVGLLIVLFLWFGNLTLFNWWAAGGPPTPHPERYASRGIVFFTLTCLSLLGAIILAVVNVRRMKRR